MNQLVHFFLPLEWILLILFLSSSITLVFFYILRINKINQHPSPINSEELKPVSIVLSGKNQYEFLKVNLPFFLEQNYPTFEVVVVYDKSEEENYYLLKDFEKKYPTLKLVNFSQNINFFDDNRFSISIGIKSAKHEYILLTTADCRPVHENWILEMQKGFEKDIDIVMGYTTYKAKKLFAEGWSGLFQNNLLYLSSAISGKPYIANNQNIGYRKQYFLDQNGYTSHYAVDSGEYEIIEKIPLRKNRVNVVLSPQSFTQSQKKTNISFLLKKEKQMQNALRKIDFSQKKQTCFFRYATTCFYLTFAIFLIYSILYTPERPFSKQYIWMAFLGAYLLKTTTQEIIYAKCVKKLNEAHFLYLTPIFEVLYLPLQIVHTIIRSIPQKRK